MFIKIVVLENFFAYFFNHFTCSFIDTWEGTDTKSLGQTWNKVFCTVFLADPANFFIYQFRRPVGSVDGGTVNTAHKSYLTSVFFNQFRNVVGTHSSLPDINPHINHVWNQCCSVRITVVDNQFYSMRFIIAVNLFVRRQNKFLKHGRRNKG